MDGSNPLVSTEWLAARLGQPGLRVLDAGWFLPAEGRDGRAEYEAGHIPGAVFFDIDEIADHSTDLPHMAPQPADFAAALQAMGVGEGDGVVVYDHSGIRSAARVWWTFRLMGHTRVAVLDGGFGKWQAEARPVEAGVITPAPAARPITARRDPTLIRDIVQVAAAAPPTTVLDARAAPRFRGEAPEPRAGLRAGHIPGARNLPFTDLLTAEGTLRPEAELRAAFAGAGVDLGAPVITTCGSGVTASVLALALARLGHDDWAVYDGSWAEWGADHTRPLATGEN